LSRCCMMQNASSLNNQKSKGESMNIALDRTLEIKRELSELNQSLKMSVQKAIKIGELLTEQKEFIGHGNFLSWLEDNLDISQPTAWRYVKLYEHNDKIFKLNNLQEAYVQIETIERQEKMSAEEKKRLMIAEFRKTGKKPEGWDRSLDYAIQKEKEEKAKCEARAQATIAQMRKDEEDYRKRKQERESENLFIDEAVKMATEKVFGKLKERNSWKDKIRLSDSGKDNSFNDAIIDYLETLPDDNRRIEACNNIIKICRNISVDLQKVK